MFSRRARRKPYVLSLLPVSIIVIVFVFISLALTAHSAYAATAASSHVDVMVLNSEINPASLHFLTRAISTAETDGAQALVIEIDTPGGDIASMESMKEAELNSTVPIISYVSPTGAHAASAGAFITLAAQIAAMAPGTTIGASSPVTSTGGDIGSTLKAKIESVLVSDMTIIQNRYHRQVLPATKMVTDAASYTDQQAAEQGIIDVQATSLSDLLNNQVNGRSITLASGRIVTLQTAGAPVQNIDAYPIDSLYTLLLDPNVIFLLFIVAMIGIFVEISHPGAILPGVVGSIALLLFLFAAGSISPNWAGLALMALAFVLLVLDVKLPTHGVLTVGAVLSLIFGALLFFNSGGPFEGPQVNPILVYAMGGLVGLVGVYIVTVIVRTRRRPATTGLESMIGAMVIASTPLQPDGRVNYQGENWAAVLDDPAASVDPGAEVRIIAIEGLLLHVQPVVERFSDPAPKYIKGP